MLPRVNVRDSTTAALTHSPAKKSWFMSISTQLGDVVYPVNSSNIVKFGNTVFGISVGTLIRDRVPWDSVGKCGQVVWKFKGTRKCVL